MLLLFFLHVITKSIATFVHIAKKQNYSYREEREIYRFVEWRRFCWLENNLQTIKKM